MKKILFICGSIEPGHDGVGDYTRELAGALIKKEIECKIVAIMDRVAKGCELEDQKTNGSVISVLRISENLSYNERKKKLKGLVSEFAPNWVSLQYVPFAFSPQGTPLSLIRLLPQSNSFKWHFMIHEAYVWSNLTFKRNILRHIEIQILKRLVKTLKPDVIHTSNKLYQKLLKQVSVDSEILELFGNIPISKRNDLIPKAEQLQGVFFGSGPLEENFSRFLDGLKSYTALRNQPFKIVFCGRPDFRTRQFVRYLEKNLKGLGIMIEERGELSASELSMLFRKSHFGISREPPEAMGKSGAAITMLEHGIPLWVPLSEDKEHLISGFDFRIDQCFLRLEEIGDKELKEGYILFRQLNDTSMKMLKSLE